MLAPAQAEHGTSAQSISELRAGPVTIKYSEREAVFAGQPLQDETAFALVRMWTVGALAGEGLLTGALATGTSAKSLFTDRDKYGYTDHGL